MWGIWKIGIFALSMTEIRLHVFNPWHDLALANNHPNYQPPASAMRMAKDLEKLPFWVALPGDYIWNEGCLCRVDSQGDFRDIKSCCTLANMDELPLDQLTICPWGWDLLVFRKLRLWHEKLPLPSLSQLATWRSLSSRSLSVRILEQLSLDYLPYCEGKSFLCSDVNEVSALLEQYNDIFVKQLWSSSGKGLRPIARGEFSEQLQNWCLRNIKTHGGIVVEPRYHRVLDFAMEFISDSQGITFCGYSVFFTDINGHYGGNRLASESQLEIQILSALGVDNPQILASIRLKLMKLLKECISTDYSGPFGVDMMVVETESGNRFVHPCVEINLRFNMGQLASHIYHSRIKEDAQGRFMIDYFPRSEELLLAHQQMLQKYPLVQEKGRISSGYLALNEIGKNTQYRAYILLD